MIEAELKGVSLTLMTAEGIFSPSSIDRGTKAMLTVAEWTKEDKILDLGCGCGVVGILAAKCLGADKVTLCDVSETAVSISRENARRNGVPEVAVVQSDGFQNIKDRDFTLILSNPPYHADFSVPKHFIEEGYQHLLVGGRLFMVTKRKEWYQNKLTACFGGVKIWEIDGYYVFLAEKRTEHPPKRKKESRGLSKKLQRKQERKKKPAGGR